MNQADNTRVPSTMRPDQQVEALLQNGQIGRLRSYVNSYAILFALRLKGDRPEPAEDKAASDRRREAVVDYIVDILRHVPAELRAEVAYRLEYEARQQWQESIADTARQHRIDVPMYRSQIDNGFGRVGALAMAKLVSENEAAAAKHAELEAARAGTHDQLIDGAGI